MSYTFLGGCPDGGRRHRSLPTLGKERNPGARSEYSILCIIRSHADQGSISFRTWVNGMEVRACLPPPPPPYGEGRISWWARRVHGHGWAITGR
jgi:hypothetical protein